MVTLQALTMSTYLQDVLARLGCDFVELLVISIVNLLINIVSMPSLAL